MKRPWMPLYIGDFVADTMHLGPTETGIYIRLLMHAWQHNGEIPINPRQLCRISGCRPQLWWQYEKIILSFFKPLDELRMTSVRLSTELSRADAISLKNNNPQITQSQSHRYNRNGFQKRKEGTIKMTDLDEKIRHRNLKGKTYVTFASPQMNAWEKYERVSGKKLPRDSDGGWYFDSEWPPAEKKANH